MTPQAQTEASDAIEVFSKLYDLRHPEELHPDLAAYQDTSGYFGLVVKHPLVFSVPHAPMLNKMTNARYLAKKKAVSDAVAAGDLHAAIYLHERPWRLDVFTDLSWRMGAHLYWDLLGGLWTDSENAYQNYDTWVEALTADVGHRWVMMDKEERGWLKLLRKRPAVRVYRGFSWPGAQRGLSWTTSPRKAAWFAHRYEGLSEEQRAQVVTGLVTPSDIIACFSGRGENEIVVLPENVRRQRIAPAL